LFERASRRVALTAIGRRFEHDLGPAYDDLRAAFETVREVQLSQRLEPLRSEQVDLLLTCLPVTGTDVGLWPMVADA